MKVVIISGLSGAGKTRAADWFEDQGYYCIDNMPPQLIRNFLELSSNLNACFDQAYAIFLAGYTNQHTRCFGDHHRDIPLIGYF